MYSLTLCGYAVFLPFYIEISATKIFSTFLNFSIDKRTFICYNSQANKQRLVGQAVKTLASHAENMGSIPVRVTKKRDRHHKRVSVSFFVLRTKPNPLARKDACRFAGILFVQGVRIPRVQSTTRYCGSAEIYVEISTDLETIS